MLEAGLVLDDSFREHKPNQLKKVVRKVCWMVNNCPDFKVAYICQSLRRIILTSLRRETTEQSMNG